jgi:hypothetical protein
MKKNRRQLSRLRPFRQCYRGAPLISLTNYSQQTLPKYHHSLDLRKVPKSPGRIFDKISLVPRNRRASHGVIYAEPAATRSTSGHRYTSHSMKDLFHACHPRTTLSCMAPRLIPLGGPRLVTASRFSQTPDVLRCPHPPRHGTDSGRIFHARTIRPLL